MKQEITDELKELGSNLAEIQGGMPYSVPEGYFSGFAAKVNSLVSNDEKMLIDGLPTKELPYTMPAGYFEQLPNRITETVAGKPKGILISFRQLRWAAAAMVIIAVGLSLFDLNTTTNDNGLLASVADKEISDYIAYTYQPVTNKALNGEYLDKIELDANEIINYLDATGWGNDVY